MAMEHVFGGLLVASFTTQVQDPAGINPPSTIIRATDPWRVHCEWSLSGIAANFIGGTWHLAAYVESVGPGFEGQVGPTVDVPLATVPPPAPRNFRADIDVPVGVQAGAYHLVTLLTYDNGGGPEEMAGFFDGPVIQIYNP